MESHTAGTETGSTPALRRRRAGAADLVALTLLSTTAACDDDPESGEQPQYRRIVEISASAKDKTCAAKLTTDGAAKDQFDYVDFSYVNLSDGPVVVSRKKLPSTWQPNPAVPAFGTLKDSGYSFDAGATYEFTCYLANPDGSTGDKLGDTSVTLTEP